MATICRMGFITAFLLLLFPSPKLFSQLRINEFMAANINAHFDVTLNYTDWVELFNNTGSTINLNNYSLTDDPSDPRKYVITGVIEIPPYSYFLISLDKLSYVREAYQSVHANFSLDKRGEFLAIYHPYGALIDSVSFKHQVCNISYGRLHTSPNEWVYFTEPSPGAANITSYLMHSQTAAEVVFSQEAGFYPGDIFVELSASGDADEIRYTLNGDFPDEKSRLYTDPIHIGQNTVIRAVCLASGKHPGNVGSNTYFIDIQKPNLPVVSISTDNANFNDWYFGIYVDGINGITNEWCSPDKKVNWMRDWERPMHVEYFTQDGEIRLSQLVGTKVYGGCSRSFKLRSLALISRQDYGKRGLDYRFFSDKDIYEYKSLILRNSGNDAGSTMLRDGFMQSIIRGRMDIDYQAYQPVLVYMNGQYFGLMNLREKMNEHYAASNHGVDDDNVDVIEHYEYVVSGNRLAFDELMDYISSHSLSNQIAFNHVDSLLDVDEYLNYFITNIYYENEDWPQNNSKLWRERKVGAKWRALLYDTDFGFGLREKSGNTLAWATRYHKSTQIFRGLLQNENCRNEFIQRFAAHINTTFDPHRILPILDSLKTMIAPYIPYQVNNWGVPYTFWEWNYNVNIKMVNFANEQPNEVRGWISEHFGLSSMHNLSITNLNPGQGKIHVCEVEVPDNYSGQHFGGIPVRLEAIAAPGYVFTGWDGDYFGNEAEIWIPVDDSISVSASFAPAGPVTGIYINELVAGNSSGIADEYGEYEDWVEIYNSNDYAVDLAGLYFSDSIPFPGKHMIPYGYSETIIPAGGYKILWADKDEEQGPLHLPFKLKRGGEAVLMSQKLGEDLDILDSLSFKDQYRNVSFGRDPTDTSLWKYLIPTPGALNQEKQVENIFINEFMASNRSVLQDTDGAYEDWIEIYNGNDFPVDLAGMFISDDPAEPDKFRIPDTSSIETTIAAHGYMIFWADDSVEQGVRHLSFGLSGMGEHVILTQPNGIDIIDSVGFGDLIADAPYGRSVDGSGEFSYLLASPGSTNTQPVFINLYINEFMASNRSVLEDRPGEFDDWLEIYNANNFPVNSGGLFLSDSAGRPIRYRIPTSEPDSTTIPAYGHLVFWADDSTEQGVLHTNFKLSGKGEQIVLSSPTGREIIDSISYGDLISDVPFGRMYDASEQLCYLTPTPGAANNVAHLENIYINEVLASNRVTNTDEFGESDDWIELYNGNDNAVDIGGLFITDSYGSGEGCRISTGSPGVTTIPADGYLLIWADDSTEQGALHVGFKLNRSGEKLVLLQADGLTVLDSMSFGEQVTDISTGRYPDGTAGFVSQVPSPGEENRLFNYDGLIISELMASDHNGLADEYGEYEDWIELFNSGDQPVNIAGMAISDTLGDPARYFIPAGDPQLTTIDPGDYLVLFADNQPGQGALHLDFGLRESGEQVGIFTPDGTLIDSITYPNQYNNFSYSLTDPDFWIPVPPTPGEPNDIPQLSNVYFNEYMSDNENKVSDEFGEYDDWVELYNDNEFPVNVAGLYLSDSIAQPDMYRISSNDLENTEIPAKGYLTVWTDDDAGQGALHTNFRLSRSGETILLSGYDFREEIDKLEYSEQYSNFATGKLNDAGPWADMPPTPGAANILPDLSFLFINEIMTSNQDVLADNYGEFDDWIEIYNAGSMPVDIGGLFISDDKNDPDLFRISSDHADSTTIPPYGFILIWADDSTEQGILHSNFKLSRSGEQVALFGYDGSAIVDSITYAEVPRNISYGRISDGYGPWRELPDPTPMKSNIIDNVRTTFFGNSKISYSIYPNPAIENIQIALTLESAANITMEIYNNTGILQSIPVHGYYAAGTYDFMYDLTDHTGSPLPDGVYHYVIRTDKLFIEDKLIILKGR